MRVVQTPVKMAPKALEWQPCEVVEKPERQMETSVWVKPGRFKMVSIRHIPDASYTRRSLATPDGGSDEDE